MSERIQVRRRVVSCGLAAVAVLWGGMAVAALPERAAVVYSEWSGGSLANEYDGHLKKLPGGGLNWWHRDFKFDVQDIRFTVGKNGKLYAFTMNVPEAGQTIRIHAMVRMPATSNPSSASSCSATWTARNTAALRMRRAATGISACDSRARR